jgi:hypothetical protein
MDSFLGVGSLPLSTPFPALVIPTNFRRYSY